MEPAEAWEHYWGFQSGKNRTVEELHPQQAADVWAPTTGFPVEYASIDIFGTTCSLQEHVPGSSGGQQLVAHYYYCAATQHDGQSENPAEVSGGQSRQQVVKANSGKQQLVEDLQDEETNKIVAGTVCKQVAQEFKDHMNRMEEKIHKYPAVLSDLKESYSVPRIVAIGPYHHNEPHLKRAETVKHAAATHCIRQSGDILEQLYSAVASAADDARRLYDKDVMAGIGIDDFRHMMFFDACFLVQFMLMRGSSRKNIDPSLHRFLSPNREDITHDLMLLENQLPWQVVMKVIRFMHQVWPEEELKFKVPGIVKGWLQDQFKTRTDEKDVLVWDDSYKPQHLLGLIRHYSLGRRHEEHVGTNNTTQITKMSFSVSAMELAEIGIRLTANKTGDLIDMGLKQEGVLFPELFLAPLCLDRDRASYLVNMVAHELCTVESFASGRDEDSAVCSYVLLLAMLIHREEDVHELRARGILRGGGGLTNHEALQFFTTFQSLRYGPSYTRIMKDIEIYKENRRIQTKCYAFFFNNMKIIAAVITGVGAVGGIIATLLSIKQSV